MMNVKFTTQSAQSTRIHHCDNSLVKQTQVQSVSQGHESVIILPLTSHVIFVSLGKVTSPLQASLFLHLQIERVGPKNCPHFSRLTLGIQQGL